jgi:hypothetical protein
MPNDHIYKDRITDIIQLCQAHFVIGNRKDFIDTDVIEMLESLVKDQASLYLVEESDLK